MHAPSPPTVAQRPSHHHKNPSQLILNPLNRHKLRLEDQNTPPRNRTHTPVPIRPLRLNRQLPLLARTHVQQPLIPALDDLPLAHREGQRLAAVVRSVELAAVAFQSAAIVHVDGVASDGLALAGCGRRDFDVEGFVEGVGEKGCGEEEGGEGKGWEAHFGWVSGGSMDEKKIGGLVEGNWIIGRAIEGVVVEGRVVQMRLFVGAFIEGVHT